MALANAAKTVSTLVLGTCLPSLRHDASKFKIQYFYFDDYLKKYYRKSFEIFALDPQKICKPGDIALIEELPNKLSRTIKHKVLKIVYFYGDVTDPITGEKAAGPLSRDEVEMKNSLFGKNPFAFDYKTAPHRGWQEGKKDFSHRPTYRRYNEFSKDSEYFNQPYSTIN